MADINSSSFKEAVCIDAGRVYDSCCDRDCLEDLQCFFTEEAQRLIERSIGVRLKSAEILNTLINVEPVTFNKGYYSCDLTFFFLLKFDLFTAPNTCPTPISGISAFSKKVILYGSCGNVKIFSNRQNNNCNENNNTLTTSNMPKCVVQSVDPVALTARIGKTNDAYDNVQPIPETVSDYVDGDLITNVPAGTTTIFATIGLFTIVQLIRNVQMLIPVYDFCLPEKQCDDTTDQPCDVFRRIKFPTDDFFPPRSDNVCECGCGCINNDDNNG